MASVETPVPPFHWAAAALWSLFLAANAVSAQEGPARPVDASAAVTPPAAVGDARLLFGKWIETEQVLSSERKEWQQGKEVLEHRADLLDREVQGLRERTKESESAAAGVQKQRDKLQSDIEAMKVVAAQLAQEVTGLEVEAKKLLRMAPPPLQQRLLQLQQLIPDDPANTRTSLAERFRNVLGIFDALNKANQEISEHIEVRDLGGGRRAEVRVLYIGLAQAYYLSAGGDAGFGQPGPDGWTWQPRAELAGAVRTALEIRAGTHSPTFVPLPVRVR